MPGIARFQQKPPGAKKDKDASQEEGGDSGASTTAKKNISFASDTKADDSNSPIKQKQPRPNANFFSEYEEEDHTIYGLQGYNIIRSHQTSGDAMAVCILCYPFFPL
jgi:hypothetical protein